MNPISELSSLLAQGCLALFLSSDLPPAVTGLLDRRALAQGPARRK